MQLATLMDHLCWKLRILININNLTAEIQKVKRIENEIALNKSKKTNTLTKIMAYNNIISITQMVHTKHTLDTEAGKLHVQNYPEKWSDFSLSFLIFLLYFIFSFFFL